MMKIYRDYLKVSQNKTNRSLRL